MSSVDSVENRVCDSKVAESADLAVEATLIAGESWIRWEEEEDALREEERWRKEGEFELHTRSLEQQFALMDRSREKMRFRRCELPWHRRKIPAAPA